MSRLLLIRHAQATFAPGRADGFGDYDRLSDLGRTQCEVLGEELVGSGVVFDRVHVGPAVRHVQTAEAVGAVYGRVGTEWPDPVCVEGLAEHDGAGVVQRALASSHFASDLERLEALEEAVDATDLERQRAFFRVFRRVTRQWAREELPAELVGESWQAFRRRVASAMDRILDGTAKGATVGVFTSGGPIGSTVAAVLGLSDEQALELAWVLANATVTELLSSSDGRISLKSFNVQPRLGSPELYTHV